VQTTPIIIPYWATSSLPAVTQQPQTHHYTYQSHRSNSAGTNWWTTSTQAPQPTINLQQEEYQREYGKFSINL
jgi:hypothetical protein